MEPPATITYNIVVSRETVRIDLTLSALNEFPLKLADIQNSYITAPVTEKIWTFLGQEFGEDSGRKGIVVWALYGLKSEVTAFRNHLEDHMQHLGFLPCLADLDLWMKPMVRPEDGFDYYAYVLIYVDNVMVIHHDAESVLRKIDKYFKLKLSLIGDPDIYLGASLMKMRLENVVWAWVNSSARYVKESVSNLENYLAELADAHWQLPKKNS